MQYCFFKDSETGNWVVTVKPKRTWRLVYEGPSEQAARDALEAYYGTT